MEKFGWQLRVRGKVIQTENNHDKDVFNGDIGQIAKIDPVGQEVTVRFDQREVVYDFGELDEVAPVYTITIHKSQGSEFPAVVIPLATQQYLLLQRNLVYTGITRGKKLVVVIGQRRKALVYSRESGTPCGYILEDSVAVEVFAAVRDDSSPGRECASANGLHPGFAAPSQRTPKGLNRCVPFPL